MAELTPIPSAQRPSDPTYQPVSGYAVAAAVAAGLFVGLLLFLLIQAMLSERAALWWELLLIPAVGVILAIIARSHIRNSEGTRTGARLTAGAWWVCVLGGAAFCAYMIANSVVLERESRRRADGFFKELKDGRPTYAFEYMLDPSDKGRSDPAVPEAYEAAYLPNGYSYFKNHEMVRLMLRNGSDVELEHSGTKDVGQVATGFQATHLYKLSCPEGDFNVQVKLTAAETKQGGKSQLQWRIPADPYPNFSIKPERISQYGRLVSELEHEGTAVINTWAQHVTAGRTNLAQLMTMPVDHRQPIELGLASASLMGGNQVALFPLRAEFLPPERRAPEAVAKASPKDLSFEDLAHSGFFRTDAGGTPLPPDKLNKLRSLWPTARLDAAIAVRQLQMTQVPPDNPTIVVKPDVVRVIVAVEIGLETSLQYARGWVALESREPEVLAALAAAKAQSKEPDNLSVTLRGLPTRGWRVAWFRTDLEPQSVASGSPRGAGPGGMQNE